MGIDRAYTDDAVLGQSKLCGCVRRKRSGFGSNRLGGGRQAQPPRSPSGANRAESGSAAPEQSGQWQGQPMTGPLANPPGETERPVPFWLRSIRRK